MEPPGEKDNSLTEKEEKSKEAQSKGKEGQSKEEYESQEIDPLPKTRKTSKGPKATRSYRACALCRAQKRKCDGLVPCGPCVKFNLIEMCEYPEPKKRGRKITRPYDEKLRIEHIHKKRTSGATKEESTLFDNPEVGKHIFISDFPGPPEPSPGLGPKGVQSFPYQSSTPHSTETTRQPSNPGPYMASDGNVNPPIIRGADYKRKNFRDESQPEEIEHPRKRALLTEHPPSDPPSDPYDIPSSSVVSQPYSQRKPQKVFSPPNHPHYAPQRPSQFPTDTNVSDPYIYPKFSEVHPTSPRNYPPFTNTENTISPPHPHHHPYHQSPAHSPPPNLDREPGNYAWEGYTPAEQYLPFLDEVLNTFTKDQNPPNTTNPPNPPNSNPSSTKRQHQ